MCQRPTDLLEQKQQQFCILELETIEFAVQTKSNGTHIA